MAVETPLCDFGWHPPGFILPSVDGRRYSLSDAAGPNGTLVMFICNHCPYVKAVIDRIVRDVFQLKALGIGSIAINSNDADSHPEDSFDAMVLFAQRHGFCFPYLHDEDQAVAKAWGAVCTPDFFGFGARSGLQYRGRLDASRREAAAPDVRRDLLEAMRSIAETGQGPREQTPSMGCSIKWKTPSL